MAMAARASHAPAQRRPTQGDPAGSQEREWMSIYVDLLVDVVRRHTLLESQMLQKWFRFQMDDERERVSSARAVGHPIPEGII